MCKEYLGKLIYAMRGIIRLDLRDPQARYLVAGLLMKFMGARSLYDLALLFGIPKDRLYRSIKKQRPQRFIQAIERQGLRRLVARLRRLKNASNAVKSREQPVISADDSTRETRGFIEGFAVPHYNGALGKVTVGINIQGLVVTVGDNLETFLLGFRVVPPKHEGPGVQPRSKNEWLIAQLERIEGGLKPFGLSLKRIPLSVDCAYASKAVKAAADSLQMPLISKVKRSWRVNPTDTWPWKWRAGSYLDFWWLFRRPKIKSISGHADITYARTMLNTNSLGNLLVVAFQEGDHDPKFLFSTDPTMKAKTIRRIARLRWRIERFFWTLKQDLGFEDIHNGKREAFVVRVTMIAVLYQALLDESRREKMTPTQFIRVFRGKSPMVFHEIISGSAFSEPDSANSVMEVPMAA